MNNDRTMHALRRFGLGARPGEARRIAGDPAGFVMGQIGSIDGAMIGGGDLMPSHTTLAAVMTMRERQREARRAREDGRAARPGDAERRQGPPADRPGRLIREVLRAESDARIRMAVSTEAPFVERLVMFWSSHFTVAARKGNVRAIAGAYEREAIRPHVFGRFADMLKAVVQHPAMLVYLDNQVSVGPASRAGVRRGRGLNENLAREVLELHTLGADGSYTLGDVTALARLLTGWTIGGPAQRAAEPGRFTFAANRHDPGPHRLLGRDYRPGLGGGEQALGDLARHPSTARHIAGRLAGHFVASPPPPALVARLTRVFADSDGDLAEVARALIGAPDAWREPPRKFLPPYDYLIAVARGLAPDTPPRRIARLSAALGQPIWDPPSPKGWPDEDDAWLAPAALAERVRIAEQAAVRLGRDDPRSSARALFGDALGPATAEAIARAESARQGFEILLLSADMQRR